MHEAQSADWTGLPRRPAHPGDLLCMSEGHVACLLGHSMDENRLPPMLVAYGKCRLHNAGMPVQHLTLQIGPRRKAPPLLRCQRLLTLEEQSWEMKPQGRSRQHQGQQHVAMRH